MIQISVCIFRVYVATHFPHQVILGLITGIFHFAIMFCNISAVTMFKIMICCCWFPIQSAGMLVGKVFDHIPSIYNASMKSYLQVNCFLLSFAVCVYLLLKLLDFDPLWSVVKAKKWCENPDWIHLDTTAFAGLWRNLGALFGLGRAVNSEMLVQSCKGKNGSKTTFKLMCMAANLTFLQLYELIKMPTHKLRHCSTYCRFLKSASVPFGVVAVLTLFIC